MELIVFLCLLATGLAAPSTRIVNGDNAQLFDHPYQVSLQAYSFNSWYHTCGAVLVAPDKVVTAAHCVDKKQARNLRVVVGVHNLFDPPNEYQQTVAVASFRMHENYNGNGNGYPNDIAVITLFTPVTYNRNVQPAKLANEGVSYANTSCIISGWGQTSGSGGSPNTLQQAYILKISRAECNALWSRYGVTITDKHICVYERDGETGGRPSSCMGDSGGPMMCGNKKDELAGVTSWGVSTCSGDLPSVYTRISEYRTWLDPQIY
ncbi:fibrinolytic enzyme, isozyme C-like [Biomphalaria glabrata]|uniref:Fibrinolytic enzyme, isozyme C-like n=1 Tax=Biomphalaria glabrata TaxID=6526 RepID=A0A9W3AE18_BIOGL|nr:fibrinolytic enzyme, isozyme C-like [Biomphalaria glabrata]KAI8754268.1 fibrinolytic enzyme; isozyme C-like [Biomphalaria glabrata]